MTDTMREKIARAVGVARHGFASPGTIAQHGLIALEGLDHHIADSVLALIEPVMEENERVREILTQDELGNPDSIQPTEPTEYDKGWRDAMYAIRAALSPKSEKQDG
jgi:hypothetical protein